MFIYSFDLRRYFHNMSPIDDLGLTKDVIKMILLF